MTIQNWHVCVLIPARNEEFLIKRCLESISIATSFLPVNMTFDIILTVDSSSDRTSEIGKEILNDIGVVLTINKANVGYARKIAAEKALQRYNGTLSKCWIANTDADCVVPKTWLLDQLYWAKKGIQGIAGIVVVDSFKEHEPQVADKFLEQYLIKSDYTHPHIHGANLGIRADAYQYTGGWKELETAEDHDLWNRLIRLDVPKISDAKIFVITSGRRFGRAPKGFADKLSSYNGFLNE